MTGTVEGQCYDAMQQGAPLHTGLPRQPGSQAAVPSISVFTLPSCRVAARPCARQRVVSGTAERPAVWHDSLRRCQEVSGRASAPPGIRHPSCLTSAVRVPLCRMSFVSWCWVEVGVRFTFINFQIDFLLRFPPSLCDPSCHLHSPLQCDNVIWLAELQRTPATGTMKEVVLWQSRSPFYPV